MEVASTALSPGGGEPLGLFSMSVVLFSMGDPLTLMPRQPPAWWIEERGVVER